ncbi:hypothetical protein HOD96_01160 [Candidatus Falkowbacteria bacterium]|jgi:hypothetical protein|nr:hypothetical protein [Candidatus Falkowbacteria bacterium]MBT4432928.1 hypothetical protein [Candidatus Falkowbacteria bacterium]
MKLIKFTFIFLLLFSFLLPAQFASAASLGELLGEIGDSSGLKDGTDPDEDSLVIAIAKIIGILLSFLSVIFLILMIYGGFLWMTAGGSPDQVDKARKIIIRAVIGLIIILASYVVSWFVIWKMSGVAEPI